MSEDRPQYGIYIPPAVLDKMLIGTILPREAMLVGVIRALSNPNCVLTNTQLSERVGMKPTNISRSITKLRDMGLIDFVGFNGRRRSIKTTEAVEEGVPEKNKKKTKKRTQKNTKKISCRVGVDTNAEKLQNGTHCCTDIGRVDPQINAYNREEKSIDLKQSPLKNGDGVGIFSDTKKPTKTPLSKFDICATKKLISGILKSEPTYPPARRASISRWAPHIEKLRRLDNIPKARIKKVLLWYVDHIGEPYVPEAYSTRAFRRKFHAIARACDRDVSSNIVIAADTQAISDRLLGLGWPKGASEGLPVAIQQCREGYTIIRKQIAAQARILADSEAAAKQAARDAKRGYISILSITERFICWMKDQLPAWDEFVLSWFDNVHRRVHGWDTWNGDFHMFQFSPTAEVFRKDGRGLAQRFCNNPDVWDSMIIYLADLTNSAACGRAA